MPFKQQCGLAMETRLAPAMTTIVVGDLEEPYLDRCTKQPLLWVRYIDDVFMVWAHSREDLLEFVSGLNRMAPRITFTYTLSKTSVDFLNLTIYKSSSFSITGKLSTKIYYKSTNTFNYNHRSSFVPEYVHGGIAMGEVVRLLRNTDDEGLFERYRHKLIDRLANRKYGKNTIDRIGKVNFKDRRTYLSSKTKKDIPRPLHLNTPFHIFRPPLGNTIRGCWPKIYDVPHTALAYPTAPFPVYKNHVSIGKILSHKRRTFHTDPPSPLNPAIPFRTYRLNRPCWREKKIRMRETKI